MTPLYWNLIGFVYLFVFGVIGLIVLARFLQWRESRRAAPTTNE